jgi:glycosyltransferase involved in cell wall biosynthesis
MRVLLCFHSLVTRSNHRLAEELAAAPDVDLHVLTPPWWPEEARRVRQEKPADPHYAIRTLPIVYWRQPRPNLFAYRAGLGRALRVLQPDILDCYEEPFSLAMGQALALRARYAPRARLLFYSAQNIVKRYPPPFRLFEQWAFRAAAAAYVCSSGAGAVLRTKGYRGDLRLIPLGVDPGVFTPRPPAEQPALRAALGLDPARPVIGYLGRLHPEKGVEVLLAAVARMPEAQLALLGDGPQRPALAAQAAGRGLAERVHFFGAVPRPDLPRYLACCDILAVPSLTTPTWKEQFGRIIVEAALCGVPVVGSDSGSIPELIGETGVVVPEGDVEALRAALAGLLADRGRARSLAGAARARALALYTWERVAAQRLALYREVLVRA